MKIREWIKKEPIEIVGIMAIIFIVIYGCVAISIAVGRCS